MIPIAHIQFQVLGTSLTIYTDVPEKAFLGPRLRFGASAEALSSTEEKHPGPAPMRLALFQNPALVQNWLKNQARAERIRIGPAENDMMFYSPEMNCAAARLSGAERETARAALHAVALFVRLALKPEGIFFLHASAVARNGSAILFVGENETGKSTLAQTLCVKGWDMLADDSLPVKIQAGLVCALPIREAFNATALSDERCAVLAARGSEPAELEGFMFSPPVPAGPVPIRAVFFPRWGLDRPGTSKAAAAFALKTLYGACGTPLFSNDIAVYDGIVGMLIAQAGLYHFTLKKGQPPPEDELVSVAQSAVEAHSGA